MTRANRWLTGHAAAACALTLLAGCGGGGGSPTAPDSGSPGASGATVTITNGRVSPSSVTIKVGQSVTFVNNDGAGRNISSDPHPAHSQCPAINAVGNLANGQSKLTNALTTARTCGFHDHDDPLNTSFMGSIVIQP